MKNFTPEEFQPSASTILFIKQFARMCNNSSNKKNGYDSFSLIACC